MNSISSIAPENLDTSWLVDGVHREWLKADAQRQFDFFRPSLRSDGGFDVLDWAGLPIPGGPQELHTTARLVHSYALGKAFGYADCDGIIDAGMAFLWGRHRDPENGGYLWSVNHDGTTADGTKLAYGHIFTLLAATSAKQVGHPDADRLIADVAAIIDRYYWEEENGLLCDEYNQNWTPFSDYRGMNANMHGVEGMLAAYEATNDPKWLERAGRIIGFFVGKMAPANGWRLPEHYKKDWSIDPDYQGNPMFRPAGSTPGHSLELGRLVLQHWDLQGRPKDGAAERARNLIYQALADAWSPNGGLAYTLDLNGNVAIADRYWWPVTEGIGALAVLLKLGGKPEDEAWYRRLWQFADSHLIDHKNGGWFPELDAEGNPTERQFFGKPDLYHSIQAALFPTSPAVSNIWAEPVAQG